MTPSTTSQFNLSTQILRVTDTFDYSSIIYTSAYGNITAKIGNTIFHTNPDFNGDADIVIGTNTYKDIDLPTSGGKIREGSYTVIYNLLVNYGQSVIAPGSDVFSSILITPSSAQFIAQIAELLTQFDTVTIQFLRSDDEVLGSSIVTGTSGSATITFDEVEIEQAQADVAKILIAVTYTQTNEYIFTNCDAVEAKVDVQQNCAFAQLTVQDITTYPAYVTSVTRELTIQYPRTANGTPVEATVTTDEASKTIGPYIWSGGYTISLVLTLGWVQDDDLIIVQETEAFSYPNVQCDAGLCKAAKCIEALGAKYILAVKNGSPVAAQLFQDNFIVLLYYMRYNLAMGCGDTALAAALLSEMIIFLNMSDCNCGCGDTSSSTGDTEPQKIYPLFSTQ